MGARKASPRDVKRLVNFVEASFSPNYPSQPGLCWDAYEQVFNSGAVQARQKLAEFGR